MSDFLKTLGFYFLVGLVAVLAIFGAVKGFQVNPDLTAIVIICLVIIAIAAKEMGIIGAVASIIVIGILYGLFKLFQLFTIETGATVKNIIGESSPIIKCLVHEEIDPEKGLGIIIFVSILLLYAIGRGIYNVFCFFSEIREKAKKEKKCFFNKLWQIFAKGIKEALKVILMAMLILVAIIVLIVIIGYGIDSI